MKIQKWSGLVTAASPYALTPESTVEQNNLQIRKPGQLTPRPGMSVVYAANTSAVLGIHRVSPGSNLPDRVMSFVISDDSVSGTVSHQLTNLSLVSNTLQPSVIYNIDASAKIYPSFAQDRHGSVFVFLGNGIQPRTYRYSVDPAQTVEFGLPAPTVAPVVTPSGDGWFIERVDVLSAGTSYYTPPILTVQPATLDTPARAAQLKAVVQAGQIVAVDVVDGGSNYRGVPTVAVSNEQVGTGFLGKGVLGTSLATYGFRDTTTSSVTGSLTTGNTYSSNLSTTSPRIGYKIGTTDYSVDATFDTVTGVFTALLPLTAQGNAAGTGAFAEFKFNPLSANALLGNATVDYQTAQTQYTTTLSTTNIKWRTRNVGWYDSADFYENTVTPANSGVSNFAYNATANRDKFWGLMPYPNRHRFAKQQISWAYWQGGDFWSSGSLQTQYANFYFPDYTNVGYRLLVGPEDALSSESNWEVGSSVVQLDASSRPYIDITLKPAKTTGGLPRRLATGGSYPVIRVWLAFCPDVWTVNHATGLPLTAGDNWKQRYHPMCGPDRRNAAADPTGDNRTTSNPSGTLAFYSMTDATSAALTSMDTYKRWWSQGHCFNNPQKRPIVGFRSEQDTSSTSVGFGADTIQVISAGTGIERGTKFAIRFEQYNAAGYRLTNVGGGLNTTWVTATDNTKFPPFLTIANADMERKGDFNSTYTDFYFEANEVDTSSSQSGGLLPGSVNSQKVTVSGTGWTAASQTASVILRQRKPDGTGTVSDGQTYSWNTVELAPAVAGSRIVSVDITSQGQNYWREPTILFRGGGGYGLKMQSAVSGGRVTSVVVIDGGDGFTSDTVVYTDVQPAKLLPILRGTMTGIYRCAYRYADYSQTVVATTTISTEAGKTQATLTGVVGVKPDMQITGAAAVPHLARIVGISGNTITLSKPATATATTQACVVRDMTLPVTYSDFSPIVDVEANANGSTRASEMLWSLPNVTAPFRCQYVEFFRTSADQSLVFYRLDQYGTVDNGQITIVGSDTLSDEDLFDIRRPAYAALPVVLPNGALNAYRFGNARKDMSAAVAWQDRLWYGVSTSGQDANTVFFSEYDEFESCPDINEIPIQNNLRSTDYLSALVPFGSSLMAMQSLHCYSISYNTDPSVDAVVNLVAHRGCVSQRCWDIHEEMIYAMDERGVYRMSTSGEVENLSEPVRDYFTDPRLDFQQKQGFFLKVDQITGILRAFVSLDGDLSPFPTIALCYHIKNKAWWTESWPTGITAAGEYRSPGKPDAPIYGALDGSLYAMGGKSDVTFRDLQSVTITNAGSGYSSPPTVTASGGYGAELRAVVRDGQVVAVLIAKGGYGYGTLSKVGESSVFNATVAITFSGGGGSGAAATGTARTPSTGESGGLPIRVRAGVPWSVRTPPMPLATEANARGGDGLVDRSITVTYRPCETDTTLNLREYYNNSSNPRENVMRRDRGTGFVHSTEGARTTLNMIATRSALGTSTGLAQARFAGRSMDDLSSADRHLAIELSCDPQSFSSESELSQPLIYALEVRGVVDGD